MSKFMYNNVLSDRLIKPIDKSSSAITSIRDARH